MAGLTRYSVDGDVRNTAVRYVTMSSFVLAVAFNIVAMPLIESAISRINIEGVFSVLVAAGIVGSIGSLALFGFIWWLFDAYLWRIRPLVKWHGIIDLNGTWEGKGISSCQENGVPVEFEMTLKVTQTFSEMQCAAEFEHSSSLNRIVGMHSCNVDGASCTLEYSYVNTAGGKSIENERWDDEHRGFCWIECRGDTMHGRYFTNRKNSSKGAFELHRVKHNE